MDVGAWSFSGAWMLEFGIFLIRHYPSPMFCPACGTEISASSELCPKCGAGLANFCSHCQANLPSGAKFCSACGKPVKASLGGLASAKTIPIPHAERKQVTVLFADFSGFTSFAHKHDAEDVRDFMSSV